MSEQDREEPDDGPLADVTELSSAHLASAHRREARRPETNSRVRMSGQERREQLLDVGRKLFADKGFEVVTVEEIAAKAGVSKPVVYEHFGGKEGLYAVVVDREMNHLLGSIGEALTAYSSAAAAAVGRADVGLLVTGRRCDATGVDRDLLHASPDELAGARVTGTITGGVVRFARGIG